jgi:tRNA-dihydrouridine synthase
MTRIVYRCTMRVHEIYHSGGLYFAPMEGVTDEPYRQVIHQAWPEWDYYCTDFLRIPTHGNYPSAKILSHYGQQVFQSPEQRKKTGYQILTTARAQSDQVLEAMEEMGFKHLDLNLGCPSKKVNSHKGGAYLLHDQESLIKVIKTVRQKFSGVFTVKMRVGYHDDKQFLNNLSLLQDLGVEAITLHARTRDQLYQGVAKWSYIEQAVKHCQIPIIGNGDVWTVDDIDEMFEQTGCHGIMIGRGALKTPWLATLYRQKVPFNEAMLLQERRRQLETYFDSLLITYRKAGFNDEQILKRFKSYSRFLFDDFPDFEVVRGRFLRSVSLAQFLDRLFDL